MTAIANVIYFTVTLLVLGGLVALILYITTLISNFTSTTKEKLKKQGYDISGHGVAVQTKKRFNREDYVDATQRGLVKALGASSFGRANSEGAGSLRPPEHDHTVKKTRSGGLLHRKSDANVGKR